MMSIHCFLCGARLTAVDLRSEFTDGGVTTRRYECSICAAVHAVSGYTPHAVQTGAGEDLLTISRRRAAQQVSDLASAVANECVVPVPMNFLVDFAQAMGAWAEGDIPSSLRDELARVTGITQDNRLGTSSSGQRGSQQAST